MIARLLAWLRRPRLTFRYERNPYRRWCNLCGGRQESYCHGGEGQWHRAWWEPVGESTDPDCRCHSLCPDQFHPCNWMTTK